MEIDEMDVFQAIRNGDVHLLQDYLDSEREVEIMDPLTGMNPMFLAIEYTQLECIRALLPHFDINELVYGTTFIIEAVKGQDRDIVSLLIQEGADPYIKDARRLDAIDHCESSDILMILKKCDFTPNRIIEAVKQDDIEILTDYLKSGNPNLQNIHGQTLIQIAYLSQSRDAFAILLEHKDIYLDHEDSKGNTILTYFARYDKNMEDLFEFVLEFGANPLYINSKGVTPLDIMASYNRKQLIEKTISKLLETQTEESVRQIISYCQQTSPKIIQSYFPTPVYSLSGRTRTNMQRLLRSAIPIIVPLKDASHSGQRNPSPIPKDKIYTEIKNWDIAKGKYCCLLDWKSHHDVLIPVTRYGLNRESGYYHDEPLIDSHHTWYYMEAESDFRLYAPRVFSSKNKLTMYLYFNSLIEMNIDYIPIHPHEEIALQLGIPEKHIKRIPTILNTLFNLQFKNYSNLIDILLESEHIPLTSDVDNYFLDKDGDILFEGGDMDELDPLLWEQARYLGYDVLIFTSQAGCSGRLVSECVDVRKRSISFDNIYMAC